MISEPEKVQQFFIEHLNRLYCAKAHLVERLEEIGDEAKFIKVKHIITDTIQKSENQIHRLDKIYNSLHIRYSFEKCGGLIAFLEDSFSSFQLYVNDPYLSYILILSYLQHIESVVSSSCQLLQLLSLKMENPEIENSLAKMCDDTDRTLYNEITTLYIVKQ